jgi:hypothetical protein
VGYAATTALEAVSYYHVDAVSASPDMQRQFSEKFLYVRGFHLPPPYLQHLPLQQQLCASPVSSVVSLSRFLCRLPVSCGFSVVLSF